MLRTYHEIRDRVNGQAYEAILGGLPEGRRQQFIAEHDEVADGAPERLQEFLHAWWMKNFQD